jgi:hypothetical protein
MTGALVDYMAGRTVPSLDAFIAQREAEMELARVPGMAPRERVIPSLAKDKPMATQEMAYVEMRIAIAERWERD